MALRFINETQQIFFSWVLFLLALGACQSGGENGNKDLLILWEKDRAVGISITNSDPEFLIIKIKDSENQPVLGEWTPENDRLAFRALVPFTPGITYELYKGQELVETFQIEGLISDAPDVIGIYPSADTLPENLLKMYLQFSSPMREGKAIQNIAVLDLTNGDTLEGTFLDLQPELWNEDYTLLTLWLDPGRIKRGLIPNQTLGAPLEANTNYRLVISSNWTNTNGFGLAENISKDFYTIPRDESSPDPKKWKLITPKSGTKDALRIEFLEPLDAILAREAIQLLNSNRKVITGNTHLSEYESAFEFLPDSGWNPGDYTLKVETRLEDLAGNNINRLFDMDIYGDRKVEEGPEYIDLAFRIE
jgi:hypothetical protein